MKKPFSPHLKSTRFSKKPFANSAQWGRKVLLGCILLLIVFWIGQKIQNPNTFPIRHVNIIDNSHRINHAQLQEIITPFLLHGILLLESKKLKEALEKIAWTQDVVIQKKLPDTLLIQIIERTPIAKWNNISLLDTTGNIFPITLQENQKNTDFNTLPALFGNDTQQTIAWNDYQTVSQALTPLSLTIKSFTLSPNGLCLVDLANGIHLILNEKSLNQDIAQFAAVYPNTCQSKEKNIDTIDLRYSNGFAIKWKNPEKKPLKK